MFSLANDYYRDYSIQNRRRAYCIGQKAQNAFQNAAEEAVRELEKVKDKRERSLKLQNMNERFSDIVAMLKSIRARAPEAELNSKATMMMC